MTVTVDIGIAASSVQHPEWWSPVVSRLLREQQRGIVINQFLATASALPDSNKNEIVKVPLDTFDRMLYESKRRGELTDANRDATVQGFMGGSKDGVKSDWLFWMDDDTIPPDGVITKLLQTGKNFVAGLYYLAREPFNPIAYIRDSETKWGYRSVYGFPMGSLFQVDSVGMGCTLIHRSVYEKIKEEHKLYRRPDGTLLPIHKSLIRESTAGAKIPSVFPLPTQVVDDVLIQYLDTPSADDARAWPFYAMEYIRTEDHYFCELAANVGIRPWIDSTIICEHLKPRKVTYLDYKKHYEMLMEENNESPSI